MTIAFALLAVAVLSAVGLTGCLRTPNGIVSFGSLMDMSIVSFGNASVTGGNALFGSAGNAAFASAGNTFVSMGNADIAGCAVTPAPGAAGVATAGNAARASAVSGATVSAMQSVSTLLGKPAFEVSVDEQGNTVLSFTYEGVAYTYTAKVTDGKELDGGGKWDVEKQAVHGVGAYTLRVMKDKSRGTATRLDKALNVAYIVTAGAGVTEDGLNAVASALIPAE